MQELRDDSFLTPETFARHFADFKFKLLEQVQPPEQFLATKTGDCDDYATLAADILKSKGYHTKLVVVFMPKDIHVVCYVQEAKGYLDFNARVLTNPIIPCDGSLVDIAEKVAESFRSKWYCVSEFTFENGNRRFVYTDFRSAD